MKNSLLRGGLVLIGFLGSASKVLAASLLTSASGYTGPALDLSGASYYQYIVFPVNLPGGITVTASDYDAVVGHGGYFLNDNGLSFANIVATNSGTNTVTFRFSTAVGAFGSGFNYSLNGTPVGNDPVIAAYDVSNNLIASYDLHTLAPINTPNATDAYLFRGIDGGGTSIASFTISGSYIIIAGADSVPSVPEPASWALMVAGFGLVGFALRQRTTAQAA